MKVINPRNVLTRVETGLTQRLGHRSSIDGVRGIAVILVMLAHTNFQLGANGVIGVDVFFALSGFLITTLLLEEHSKYGKISLKGFYIRRATRLFPALLLILIMVMLYAFIIASYAFRIELLKEVAAAFLYVYNISWLWGWGGETQTC